MGQEQIQDDQMEKLRFFLACEQACLLNCEEQRLTPCSKLRVNSCICNFHAVICVILSQIGETKRFFFFSSLIYSVTLPPRSVDYHSRFAWRCWQVCGRGGERSRHCCLICVPQQSGSTGRCPVGDGTKPTAVGQPSGQTGAQVTNSLCSSECIVQLFYPGPKFQSI